MQKLVTNKVDKAPRNRRKAAAKTKSEENSPEHAEEDDHSDLTPLEESDAEGIKTRSSKTTKARPGRKRKASDRDLALLEDSDADDGSILLRLSRRRKASLGLYCRSPLILTLVYRMLPGRRQQLRVEHEVEHNCGTLPYICIHLNFPEAGHWVTISLENSHFTTKAGTSMCNELD